MTRHCLASLLAALVLLPSPAFAQRPMTIVDLISVPVVSTPQLSPDGTQVVYVQADADWTANKRVSHLWRVRTDGTGTAQLTSGKEGETQPRWSPDGKWIAFVGKRDGAETAQIQLLPLEGGEARAAHHPRHRREQPGVVARRPLPLLHGRGRQVGRAAGAREGQGRRLRLRREHPDAPPVAD